MNKAFKKPKPYKAIKRTALLNAILNAFKCDNCRDDIRKCYCLAA